MPLKITVIKKENEVFLVSPVGSVDSETFMQLDKAIAGILDSSPKGIIFNMEGVTYISSMGLSVMFKTEKAAEKIGGTVAVVNLQPQIKRVFEAVKFIPSHIFEGMKEANRYFDTFLTSVQQKEQKQEEGWKDLHPDKLYQDD